ncbi:hypothetical protein PDIG_35280 [Penicillium digitatum PHI26]|uniref:Uncharacterized protein n=2 Tax=Penicillium digitatum TaxID=36651 RepID=K9FWL4_PEND2|nr:hypothetical protein PDIP_54830 [Penicillium digitatum Pd1]EKV11849.1 hypothetical protein PDIP_54830 [Penicillium digitatum Pd1]EKV14045.1 hypothetical protein PDIG_35280 [Penicillium digitatum PHI26]
MGVCHLYRIGVQQKPPSRIIRQAIPSWSWR